MAAGLAVAAVLPAGAGAGEGGAGAGGGDRVVMRGCCPVALRVAVNRVSKLRDLTEITSFQFHKFALSVAVLLPAVFYERPAGDQDHDARNSFINNLFDQDGDGYKDLMHEYHFFIDSLGSAVRWMNSLVLPVAPHASRSLIRVVSVELPIQSKADEPHTEHSMLLWRVLPDARGSESFFLLWDPHNKPAASVGELVPAALRNNMKMLVRRGLYYMHGGGNVDEGRCRSQCLAFLLEVAARPDIVLRANETGAVKLAMTSVGLKRPREGEGKK